ncbi:MAG: DUF4091 domain-containing protein [Armatimonadetes bacterium]|nr:DUF4091 domain-containing protein [Armatimonadota bacterium]
MSRALPATFCVSAVFLAVSCPRGHTRPFSRDQHTVLLMHFDGDLTNECEDGNPATSEVGTNDYTEGVFGKSLVLLGPEDVVVVPDTKDYRLSMRATDAFTIELYLKHYQTTHDTVSHVLVCKGTGDAYMVSVDGNRIGYVLWGRSKWEGFRTEAPIEQDRWTHIAVTYQPEKMLLKVFRDGVLADIREDVPPSQIGKSDPVKIGGLVGEGADRYTFRGEIDELRISKIVRYDPENKAKKGGKVYDAGTPEAVRKERGKLPKELSRQEVKKPTTPWLDTYYQYRIPVEIETKQAGWHVIPVDETIITSAINRLEEMQYSPTFFAYNYMKVAEVGSKGHTQDLGEEAGFFLVLAGEELFKPTWLGRRTRVRIPAEAGAHYLASYTAEGDKESPLSPYAPTFPPAERQSFTLSSYEPCMLPLRQSRGEVLLLSDGEPLWLELRSAWTSSLKQLSVRKAKIALLANLKKPGLHKLMLYYQPFCSHHLMVPALRRPALPSIAARLVAAGPAEKYLGRTRYRLTSNDVMDVWFAETTVKLTPTTPPPLQTSPAIRIAAAANEQQSFQIVLHPKKPLKLTGVKATALTSGASKIPREKISLQRVEYVPIKKSSWITPARYQGVLGDPLVPFSPQFVWEADGNHVLWATVEVPAGTAPGLYKGTIEIGCALRASLQIPLEMEVYDFELPEYSTFQSHLGGQYFVKKSGEGKNLLDYHGLTTKADLQKVVTGYYDVMAKNKFYPKNAAMYTEIGMKWDPPPQGYNVDKPGNFFRLYEWDFTEYNKVLTHYIDDLKVNSLCLYHTNPTVCNLFRLPAVELKELSTTAPHVSAGWQTFRGETTVAWDKRDGDPQDLAEITQKQFDRLLLDYFRPLAENLEEHGWLKYAYILVDETHDEKRFLHFLRVLKSDPLTAQIKVVCCVQGMTYFNFKEKPEDEDYAYNGLLDMYLPEIDECYNRFEKYYFTDHNITPDWQKLGVYVVHGSRVCIDTPGLNNRIIGLDVFRRGASLYLIWDTFGYDLEFPPPRNPWLDSYTRFGNGALSYFYPPSRHGVAAAPDFTVTPSLRIMTFREGVEDYDYARILERLVAEADKKGVDVSKGKAVLRDTERLFHNSVHWSQNDAWYLDLRDRMARAIVSLKARRK